MIMLSRRREVGEFRKRYKWMALVVIVVFLSLAGRMAALGVVNHDYWAGIARDNITKTFTEPATRGLVRDTRGRIIASNRPAYNVFITPQLIDPDDDVRVFSGLMGFSTEERADFERRLEAIPLRRRTHQIQMFTEISRDQLAGLETHSHDLPGVDVVAVPVRTYGYGSLGAHTVGYLNEVNADDLERLQSQGYYRAGDSIGRTGVERSLESVVRGRRGFRRIVVDARGRRQVGVDEAVGGQTMRRPAVPGQDIVLTLDMELMRIAQRAMRGHPGGAVVVTDVNTGRVRALYSKPSYDLNEMSGRMSVDRYRELTHNPFRPLIDKTIYESYFPGSTFKPISALAGLTDGVMDPNQRIECVGYYEIGSQRQRCNSVHGDVDMHEAIVQSCNVYFWKLAEVVGLERLNTMARSFGLGERTGIGINSEASGFLASRAWYEEHYGRFRIGYTLNTAIGQGNTRVTLLQLALAYGALANGGTLYVPQLIESIQGPDGSVIEEFEPQVRRQVSTDAESLEYVLEGMRGVVNDPSGTAYEHARIEGGVEVAGKTGTAEISPGSRRTRRDTLYGDHFRRSHAWFAGFAPVDEPELAIVVLVEHGGAGGRVAAPLGTRILQEHLGARATTPNTSAGRGR